MSSERPVPPYDERKAAADPVDGGGTEQQGVEVGGARHHRTSDPGTVDDPGGRTASPAEERPAASVDGGDREARGSGPRTSPA
jgi:hypothetical protein